MKLPDSRLQLQILLQTITSLQTAVNQVSQWASYHIHKFSLSKTMVMHFHKIKRNFQPTLFLGMDTAICQRGEIFGSNIRPKTDVGAPHQTTESGSPKRLVSCGCFPTCRGSRSHTLLRLYRALVCSKLEYGCEAYSSASPTVLKMMDPVHNEALRICTGAFRSSPVNPVAPPPP